jgi:multiple sugar transport system substrate-binding protein
MWKRFLAAAAVGMLPFVVSPGYAADTVIELWSNRAPDPSNVRGAALKYVLDEFEAQHPGVKVNVTVLDWKEISTALMRAARAKQTPDLAMLYGPYITQHIGAGSIRALDDYMTDDVRKNVVVLPVAQKGGKIYGLPWEVRVMGYLYRADLFDEAGIPSPATHADLVAVLKKIRSETGIEGYGVSLDPTRSFAAVEWFLPMAVGLGAKILDGDGKAAFNDPAVVKVLEAMHALVQDDRVVSPEMVFVGRDDMQQRVEGGKLVFVTGGTHGLAEMRERSGLGDKLSFAPVPAFDADHPTPAVLQGWDLVIPTDAQHPDLAWELIEHWTSPEIQRYQTEHVGYMPGNRMVADDPMFDSPKFVHIKRAFDAINRGTLNFDWPENTELLNVVLSNMVAAVVSDKMSIPDAIAAAEKDYNSGLQ